MYSCKIRSFLEWTCLVYIPSTTWYITFSSVLFIDIISLRSIYIAMSNLSHRLWQLSIFASKSLPIQRWYNRYPLSYPVMDMQRQILPMYILKQTLAKKNQLEFQNSFSNLRTKYIYNNLMTCIAYSMK